MKYSEAKKEIGKRFSSMLKSNGFKKQSFGYIKEYEDFDIRFQYAVYDYISFPTQFNLYLSSKSFDKLFSSAIAKSCKNVTLSHLSQIKLFEKGEYSCSEYPISNMKEIEEMVSEIDFFLKNNAIPKLEDRFDYSTLERERNTPPLKAGSGQVGLILAKLVAKDNIHDLIEQHNTSMKKIVVPQILSDYTSIVEFVKNNDRETLLEIAGLDQDLTPKN